MCFLALLYKVVPDYPVIVGANRDEFRDRPGTRPARLARGICAGVDPRGGGTWLGVNDRGLVAGVTNIVPPLCPAAGHPRSRGLLCMDALGGWDSCDIPTTLRAELARASYNEFNLLAADAACAWAATYRRGTLEIASLAPGIHIVGNSTPNDRDDPKVARGRELLGQPKGLDEAVEALCSACRDHGRHDGQADALCIHEPLRGTLCSTIIAVHGHDATRSLLLWADGNPCQREYEDLSTLIQPVPQAAE